ncbi:hypothetical protein O6H91_Y262300 [Diphasiastrum complanatum]|nr:hypothetical protein O6H91_Y262300 [Diphasiastrum complanatum]
MAVRNLLKQQQQRQQWIVTAMPQFFIHICRYGSSDSASAAPTILEKHGARSVGVFWDMDCKPPLAIPPVKAAKRLKYMAARFGSLVAVVVYASKHSLKHLPSWSQEHLVEEMRAKGIEEAKEEEVYLCDYCGRRYRSNYALQKHFKQMHEKERERRLVQLGSMKKRGKRNSLIRSQMEKKEKRYKDVAKVISVPDKGYGLAAELQRAGMPVMAVSNKPQAAAIALQKHMIQFVQQGINCVWLVSHDTRFVEVLEMARQKQLHTIVMSENPKLQKCADICFSWGDLGSHLAMVDADDTAHLWLLEDSVRGPPHNNFLTSELARISTREDLRAIHVPPDPKDDQVISDSDQFDSTSESGSDFSDDDVDFSRGSTERSSCDYQIDEEFSDCD